MSVWYRLVLYLVIGIVLGYLVYRVTRVDTEEGFTVVTDEKNLVTGQSFHALCKYNLDERYPLIPYDDTLEEGDKVFLKVKDITKFTMNPPSKKVSLVVGNNDETFNDHLMNRVKPYVTEVYAVNSSAAGAIQIPMGFRDAQYTPHTTMYDIEAEKTPERDILCLVNFLMATTNLRVTVAESRGERQRALDAFKGKKWATIADQYIKYDFGKSMDHSDEETKRRRLEYYRQLRRTKVVICPPGAGMDTHRVYECLFFGCIPVIKSSFLDPMYAKLGGCWIIQDWADVTEQECERRWNMRTNVTPRLDIHDWIGTTEGFQGAENTQTVSFISYGNEAFAKARERIGRQASEMGIFNGVIKLYKPDDISDHFKQEVEFAFSQNRGGGYWTWKPYIIHDMLSKIGNNDILVYVDSGCILNKKGVGRLREYIDTISVGSGKSIFSMVLDGHPEYVWTTNAVFNHFGIDKYSDVYNSDQILATISIYRKTKESMAFVSEWLKTAITNPGLFTDQFNEAAKNANSKFKDARHDQSIFSVLLKSEPHRQTAVFFDDEVDNPDENMPIKAMRQRV